MTQGTTGGPGYIYDYPERTFEGRKKYTHTRMQYQRKVGYL